MPDEQSKGRPMVCPECGSGKLSWDVQKTKLVPVADGRLTMHDVGVDLVLGCDECSATVWVHDLLSYGLPGREVLFPQPVVPELVPLTGPVDAATVPGRWFRASAGDRLHMWKWNTGGTHPVAKSWCGRTLVAEAFTGEPCALCQRNFDLAGGKP